MFRRSLYRNALAFQPFAPRVGVHPRVCRVGRWSPVTSFSTSSSEDSGTPGNPNSIIDRSVNRLNACIKQNPAETIAVLFASDIGGIFGMYGLLSLSGWSRKQDVAVSACTNMCMVNNCCCQASSSLQSLRWHLQRVVHFAVCGCHWILPPPLRSRKSFPRSHEFNSRSLLVQSHCKSSNNDRGKVTLLASWEICGRFSAIC